MTGHRMDVWCLMCFFFSRSIGILCEHRLVGLFMDFVRLEAERWLIVAHLADRKQCYDAINIFVSHKWLSLMNGIYELIEHFPLCGNIIALGISSACCRDMKTWMLLFDSYWAGTMWYWKPAALIFWRWIQECFKMHSLSLTLPFEWRSSKLTFLRHS